MEFRSVQLLLQMSVGSFNDAKSEIGKGLGVPRCSLLLAVNVRPHGRRSPLSEMVGLNRRSRSLVIDSRISYRVLLDILAS